MQINQEQQTTDASELGAIQVDSGEVEEERAVGEMRFSYLRSHAESYEEPAKAR